jgi:hypothetical protein
MTAHKPSDWQHLAQRASTGADPNKLMELPSELNRVLAGHDIMPDGIAHPIRRTQKPSNFGSERGRLVAVDNLLLQNLRALLTGVQLQRAAVLSRGTLWRVLSAMVLSQI